MAFRNPWDAGALLVWSDATHWAKLNFERAPDGPPGVYPVVTRGVSDDAVSWSVDSEAVWLRISRLGDTFAFHASGDGRTWRLVRQFLLAGPDAVRVGIEAQSPVGDGCTATFDHITLTPTELTHMFDGS